VEQKQWWERGEGWKPRKKSWFGKLVDEIFE
jgi:hypothetical protein